MWLPLNALLVHALLQHYRYYGNRLRIECPTGSGQRLTLYEICELITSRLARLFCPEANGARTSAGGGPTAPDPDGQLLFFEYFHGDDGTGLGASHQTGWSALIAPLMLFFGSTTAADVLDAGTSAGTPAREKQNVWPAAAGVI